MPDSSNTIDDSTQSVAASAYADSGEILRTLRMPGTYDAPTHSIELVETHFAWVFLTDDFVYKLKKPVRAPGLDLERPESRYRNCCEELRLNRRLAPDVYLGLVAVTRNADGALQLGGSGQVVDWVVKMRRLPGALMLDHAIESGGVRSAALEAVAQLLVDFYRRQASVVFSPHAYVQRIAEQIEANRLALLAPDLRLDPGRIRELAVAQQTLLERLSSQLAMRAAQGRIIEAHGDLRPEHVYLGTPPCVIDCLEFSFDLRVLDPCEELAYLSMECAHAGAAWIGARMIEIYRAQFPDPVTTELIHFYESHRAATRAKIVAWHLRDPLYSDRQPWTQLAERYLREASEMVLRA